MEQAKGNKCLFCLFMTNAILVLLVGGMDMASGIAVCVEANSFNWYNGGFILLGLIIFCVSIFSFTTQTSSKGLTIYLILLAFCFLAQVGFTVGIIFYHDYKNDLNTDVGADIIRYILLGCCVIIFLCGSFALCYKNSLNFHQLEEEHARTFLKKGRGESKKHVEITTTSNT